MKLKNITNFDDFKKLKSNSKILEAREFVNNTGWNESLLGRAVNNLFSSIGKLFKKGFAIGSFTYLKNQMIKEYLKGVILWS